MSIENERIAENIWVNSNSEPECVYLADDGSTHNSHEQAAEQNLIYAALVDCYKTGMQIVDVSQVIAILLKNYRDGV